MPLAAIRPLIEDVSRVYRSLPGVGGPSEDAEEFAKAWAERFAVGWHVRTRQRIHVLTSVRFPAAAPAGALRCIAAEEVARIREWVKAFVEDTGIAHVPSDLADNLISSGRLFVWDNDGPRCMVAAARDTPNGACVNAVYTPPDNRSRGYATVAVATLSRQLLEGGKEFFCLYTDSANPTSNSIYRRIGYEPVRDDIDIDFA
jgi:predicted GNAT family acetyltransferase